MRTIISSINMNMESKGVVASLALHTVFEPVFSEMEREETLLASVQTLRDAFNKVERSHPGVTEEFLGGLLEAEGVTVDLPEALLQLACHDGDHYTIPSEEKEYVSLNQRARALKVKLSHIPGQIQDRSQFLKIIRDIASAIKDVLDAVNEVSKKHHGDPRMREFKKTLDSHKKVFVKSSRSFSDTLKRYFRDGRSESVYVGANRLLNHTNSLLGMYKAVCSTV